MEPAQNLFSTVKTISDLQQLQDDFEVVKMAIFKTDFRENLKNSITAGTYNYVQSLNFDPAAVKQAADQGLEKLKTFKTIKVRLAFEPRQTTIDKISDWVKANLGQSIVIEVEKESQLVGGAQIIFEGIYRDETIAKQIDQKQNEIDGIIKEILKN